MPALKDHTGQRFGRLVALRIGQKGDKKGWICQCDCGNEKWVASSHLTSGRTRSCGCLMRETTSKRFRTHGHTSRLQPFSRTYSTWKAMLTRVRPTYKNHGGRGITVCPEWRDFSNFLRDMGEVPPGMSIERVDNDGPYNPENCRWATATEQANNTRRNHYVEAFGKTQTVAQWAREKGLDHSVLKHRLNHLGWPVEQALTTPSGAYKCNSHNLTAFGKTQTIAAWSRETGLRRDTLLRRVSVYKWPIEKALTTPSKRGRTA